MVPERIYLAARVDDRERLPANARRLEALGHTITSRWVFEDNSHLSDEAIARMDLDDARRATWLILDELTPGRNGGREYEAGYFTGLMHAEGPCRRRVTLIGPYRNVFHASI